MHFERFWKILGLRLRSLFHRRQIECDLTEEFDYHLNKRIEEGLQQGLSPEEARYAALRAMQGLEQHKEQCRDARRVNLLENFAQDLRYAARMLRKKPGFTLVAVLSLALGIGANAAVFSLLDNLLLTKLPVRDADSLYQLIVTHRTQVSNAFSYTDYENLRTGFDIFDGVTAWRHSEFDAQVDQIPMRLHAALVTGSFYRFMRVTPALGRLIEAGDDTLGGAGVAVLGYGFWQRQFSGDPGVLGKVIQLQGSPFTIIGVTPRDFGGAEVDYPRDVTLPVHAIKRYDPKDIGLENPGMYQFSVLVRLIPGVSMESARPVLRDVWPRLSQGESNPADSWTQKLDIQPGSAGVSRVRDEFSRALIVLMVLVGLVLVITCANLANLLLARAMGRKKEIAVRLAIGAARGRLIRQSLTESLLLAVIGGGAALLLAGWMTRALLLFLPQDRAGYLRFQADPRMLLFAAALTVGTALLFGLLPAFQAVKVPLNLVINEAGRTPGTGRRSWIARAVVAAQVSICVVLVIGAFLFTRSLQNISRTDLGFRRQGLLLVDLNTAKAGILGERNDVLYQQLLTELNQTPGIASASCSNMIPLSGRQWWDPAVVPGYTAARDEVTTIYLNQVAPDYFRTLGIPVLEGREFTIADVKGTRRVAVVNQSFARRYFQGRNALGRGFTAGNSGWAILTNLEIVGVVADTKYSDPREKQKDQVYVALYQGTRDMAGTLEVRLGPGVSVETGTNQIRAIVNRIGSGVETDIRPYDTVFDRALQRDRMVALLSGLFGLLGVLLACIGLYGIVTQSVTARTAEIGIRMTLGARWWQVEWMVLRETLMPVAAGVGIGMPLALAAAQLAAGLLYGLTPFDPGAIAGTAALLVAVGAASAWIPARRASRIAPLAALRQD